MDNNKCLELIKKTFEKQISLYKHSENWKKELLSFAPPVLWFGNSESKKPKILTIGANPSRSEFTNFDKSKNKFIELKESDRRFLHLEKHFNDFTLKDLNTHFLISLKKSYDSYFNVNPYSRWFGINYNKDVGKLPYNVEGLMRGINASFYNNTEFKYSAIHIDLYPFVTYKDHKKNQKFVKADLFNEEWSFNFLKNLIGILNPEKIVVFGITNFILLNSIFKFETTEVEITCRINTNNKNLENLNVCKFDFQQIPALGLITNFGNPRGFNAEGIANFGSVLTKLF